MRVKRASRWEISFDTKFHTHKPVSNKQKFNAFKKIRCHDIINLIDCEIIYA